jgi:hypothetical protein
MFGCYNQTFGYRNQKVWLIFGLTKHLVVLTKLRQPNAFGRRNQKHLVGTTKKFGCTTKKFG